jgi:hypothetical protein
VTALMLVLAWLLIGCIIGIATARPYFRRFPDGLVWHYLLIVAMFWPFMAAFVAGWIIRDILAGNWQLPEHDRSLSRHDPT